VIGAATMFSAKRKAEDDGGAAKVMAACLLCGLVYSFGACPLLSN